MFVHQEVSIIDIFETLDDNKFHSCMTLFANLNDSNPVFDYALAKYFNVIDYALAKYFNVIDYEATLELMLLSNHGETQ